MQVTAALRCLLRRPTAARTALPPLSRASSTTSNAESAAAATEASAADEKKQRAAPEHEAALDDEGTKPHHNNLRDDVPPFAPFPRVQSHDVAPPPWPPVLQQKRRLSRADPAAIAHVDCVGPDGTSLGDGKEEEDYREYFAHRKPSPLSEVAFVDTRKPITRATDSVGEDMGRGVMVEETMDETLARAEAIFRMRKAMGDPELPHSRVLRRMLGEAAGEPHMQASL